MNNIYKVIWSKAKNCYVVASEIARSHTKSASGSEKIGGVTRRSLLASLMALSLLCGGLGVASASLDIEVVNQSGEPGAVTIYTKEGVDKALETKAEASAVSSNKKDIDNLKKAVGDLDSGLTQKVVDQKTAIDVNTASITTNRDNINTLDGKLNDLTATVHNKVDESVVEAALNDKANTDLSNLTADGENKIKNIMSAGMDSKADKTTVDAVAGKVTALENTVGNDSRGLVKDVNELKTQGNDLNNALGNKADKTELDAAKEKITTNETNITALQKKTTGLSEDGKSLNSMNNVETGALKVTGEISNGTVTTTLADIKDSMKQTDTNKTWIGSLKERTTKISYNAAKGTTVQGVDFTDAEVNANGKGLTGVSTLNTTGDATIGGALTAVGVNAGTEAITGGSLSVTGAVKGSSVDAGSGEIKTTGVVNAGTLSTTGDATVGGDLNANGKVSGNGLDAKTGAITGGSLSVTGEVKGSSVDAGSGEIKTTGVVNAGTLSTAGDATVGGDLNANGKVSGKGLDAGTGAITGGSLSVTGDTTLQNTDVKGALNVSGESNLKNTTVDGTLNVNKETKLNDKLTVTGEATFTKKVTMEDDLEVKGELKTDKIAMENKKTDADGTIHRSATTITADGITHIGEVEKSGVITKSQFTHTEKGSETYAKRGDATDWTETRSDLTADGVTTEVKDSKGNRTNTSQTANEIKGFVIDQDGNSSTASQTAKGINGNVTDKDGNKTDMNVTATENSIQIQDKDGKNTNLQVNKMDSSMTEITNADGKKTTTKQTATDITNTAEQGTIKNDAMNIENNASGNITNNAQNGTITNDAKNIVNNASENITTTAKTMDTTVTGKATESYGELDTTVNGMEKHTVNGNQDIHVTGKQTNTVESGQENIISGGQTNTITGGQINNITGDQTTTITGKKTETVTENVTEDYKKNLTTTVGGNEIHDVKGTKTETVEGKLTENFKGGQETNVTGDQTTNVSGTQTTTATDIKRNASSGMIDTIDNDYGTNTETKVAGKTTTDVSIKGTGEKGQYIRGANESRDYLIKGTLMNSETKTAEATSSEITDGTNTASTRQDAKNLAGSVTNGTETGVSGIHANDNSVSIDSIVTDGNKYSVINQKKGSIQSTVVDGTNSTVILQDKDNVTIASANGTVGIGGKDIVNNAQDTITNTAGTKITDTAGDSTVTTENGKGTTFTKTGSTAYREGGPTDTNISGNTITTGKVTMDYAEVMKDLGVHGNAKVDQNLEVGGISTLKGDVTMESNAKVKKDLTVEGITTTKTLNVTEDASVGRNLTVGGNATITGDVTANSYKVGDKTYISADGINANNQKITNVADGSISEGSKDAVNGGQLYGVKRDLEHQVDKVGANAAAMANLRPMEFDPSSKWNIAAAIGNYGSETAAALGAFYRPNDNVMVNLSTAFGTGENMVGGGVSVRLGKGGNKLSREETNALKAQVADLTARMDALLSVLNPNMSKDFPDVPENHWAYEAVSRLAGNDIVQGYPDGEFHGERTMTRYEMAEIIYNALSRGAEAERKLVEEFKPELQAMAASEKSTAEKAKG